MVFLSIQVQASGRTLLPWEIVQSESGMQTICQFFCIVLFALLLLQVEPQVCPFLLILLPTVWGHAGLYEIGSFVFM